MRGPRGEVYTTMGTRILMLADGGSVLVTKDETELVKLSVKQAPNGHRIDLPLTAVDCLSLIEFLSVAARPGSGKELVEMPGDATEPEHRIPILTASGPAHVRAKCTREDCTGTCNTCTLFICEVCNGAEATLLPTCPGRRLTHDEVEDILEDVVTTVAELETRRGRPICSVCNEPQAETPGGLTCENGHGGAPSR